MIGDKSTPTLLEIAQGGAPKQRRADPEHRVQAELIDLVRNGSAAELNPDLLDLYAIPNGGKRGIQVAARMKREGVTRGVPDLHLPVPVFGRPLPEKPPYPHMAGDWHGLYLETKVPGKNLTPEQRAFMERAVSRGFACAVYRSAAEGLSLLLRYVNGRWEQHAGLLK
jgi:hypothetical protein